MRWVLLNIVTLQIRTPVHSNCVSKFHQRKSFNLEHVYMRPEVNSNRFEMSFRLHGSLHGDFTAVTFQTMKRLYCTCANDIF